MFSDIYGAWFSSLALPDEDVPARLINIIQVDSQKLTRSGACIQQAEENRCISISSEGAPLTKILIILDTILMGTGSNGSIGTFGA